MTAAAPVRHTCGQIREQLTARASAARRWAHAPAPADLRVAPELGQVLWLTRAMVAHALDTSAHASAAYQTARSDLDRYPLSQYRCQVQAYTGAPCTLDDGTTIEVVAADAPLLVSLSTPGAHITLDVVARRTLLDAPPDLIASMGELRARSLD